VGSRRLVHRFRPRGLGGFELELVQRARLVDKGLELRWRPLTPTSGEDQSTAIKIELELEIELELDFRDVFEVRGALAPLPRAVAVERVERENALGFVYRGRDGLRRAVRLEPIPAPALTVSKGPDGGLRVRLARPVTPTPEEGGVRVWVDVRPERGCGPALEGWRARVVRLFEGERPPQKLPWRLRFPRSSLRTQEGRALARLVRRARRDLEGLMLRFDGGLAPAAGLPWFGTVFGRDSLVTALEVLPELPELARGVLRLLAGLQAQADERDPEREAEPGKIPHELRVGERALLGDVPYGLYYGSVDATPLFVWLLGLYTQQTGDRAPRPAPEGRGVPDVRAEGGQGGYAYAALRAGALLLRELGEPQRAQGLAREAEALKARFDEAFWLAREGYYALALLDGGERADAIASNPGHLLLTGLVPEARLPLLVERLLSPELFSGFGVRTLAATCGRYDPLSYHNGSVWPHDNALIVLGLLERGFRAEAQRIAQGLLDAASAPVFGWRLPELFGGFSREERSEPVPYPTACAPQAWSAGAAFVIARALR